MPKLTITGKEIGSSEASAIVLQKNSYHTRQEVLERHKRARAGVEEIGEKVFSENALRRGTHLEHSIAPWAAEEILEIHGVTVKMWEPVKSYQVKELGIASSVDRIIELESPLRLQGTGDDFVLEGEGICEIKTDFYHNSKVKPEWVIQVAHQMLCTGHKWAIIICMSQKGKLHYYPVESNSKFNELLKDCYKEFWELVEMDGDYPPLDLSKNEPEFLDLVEVLPKSHADVAMMCSDYLKANSEANSWKKVKDGLKNKLVDVLDSLDIEAAKLPGFKIVSKTVLKNKKEYVDTGDKVESHSFSIKEISYE
tara:strand:+ start:6109 stop:7038 length:930 start_codon:yes stop_codon:yes gene_type:complete